MAKIEPTEPKIQNATSPLTIFARPCYNPPMQTWKDWCTENNFRHPGIPPIISPMWQDLPKTERVKTRRDQIYVVRDLAEATVTRYGGSKALCSATGMKPNSLWKKINLHELSQGRFYVWLDGDPEPPHRIIKKSNRETQITLRNIRTHDIIHCRSYSEAERDLGLPSGSIGCVKSGKQKNLPMGWVIVKNERS